MTLRVKGRTAETKCRLRLSGNPVPLYINKLVPCIFLLVSLFLRTENVCSRRAANF
uniref:ORF2 protein n=1 Tax=Psittacine aviadenovirus B TaxID=2169709 RepID=A0AB38ZPA2_9ADEN